jgi:hypothetical protein
LQYAPPVQQTPLQQTPWQHWPAQITVSSLGVEQQAPPTQFGALVGQQAPPQQSVAF